MRYYKLLFISLWVLALSYFFWSSSTEKIKNLDIAKVVNFNDINFAGEKTPMDNQHYFNREKLVKELSISRFNVYQFVLYHKREPLYFKTIEKKLRDAWIPDDFKYLAVAESWLKNDALSDSNAGGIWQFIPETGSRYWLKINEKIDERYNFEKETDAAIGYFKKLYRDFNNWTLVAAAYNRWENWIKRALDDQKVTSYYDLYLNEETSRYVFRILAIKYLMENRYKIFDESELWDRFEAPKTKIIEVWRIDDLKSWSNQKWYIYANIKQLNWWIIWDSLPDWKWEMKVFDY
ncbi:MAG: membrane-bound lytic murein transglycosylase precursor [uncultured bacterium (gcode 4)]|uniref:Membrane-bound lytic murein transglycosylase n=1 Tax=uncultured bacterium (gcode 4) TaxID=1234023 RepID=K2H004_9BACT|nr:MAG: membrane-bound lytic murein transglycosylase precursor [uncultured bacterium (gcode 4)]